MVAVAGNDNDGSRTNSRVSFRAHPGTNYSVVVAGKSGDVTKRIVATNQSGAFQLSWYPTPPPVITSFTPTNAYPGQTITLNGTNLTGAARVLFNGVSASFSNAATNNTDLQITAIVPPGASSGSITIETPHGNTTTAADFTVLIPPTLSIQPIPGTNLVELSWLSAPGFNLQRADTPDGTNWTAAQAFSARLTNGMRIVNALLVPSNRFFRLFRP